MVKEIPPLEPRESIVRLLTYSKQKLERFNYQVLDLIGTGKSSDVYWCSHRLTKEFVAIKIITILEEEKKNGVPYSIIREISALKELDHVNIVKLLDVLNSGDDLYLVFQYFEYDLHKFMNRQSTFRHPRLVKNILHQILSALEYCHSHKFLHRDLKPQNVLIHFATSTVRLADFGAARAFDVPLSSYSNEVGSLYYMAPELLFGSTKYSTPVDICLLGTPTEQTWPGLTSVCDFVEKLGAPMKPKNLAAEFPNLKPAGVDLLSKMLCLCPNKRISAEEAIKHPYFHGI